MRGTARLSMAAFLAVAALDILVSSAYTAGTTVADNTNPANPIEIGF